MKRAFFLLIALGILFSQLNLSTELLLEGELAMVSIEELEDAQPLDPMEDHPEENEKEDSKEEKDNDAKKWQQHRVSSKWLLSMEKAFWAFSPEKQVLPPFISKIQQPPEILLSL